VGVNAPRRDRTLRYGTRRNLENPFVELTFLRNSLAVRRYEIAGIAAKWVNPSFRLGWDHVDIKLIRWAGRTAMLYGRFSP
jgi:hypothetical protein